jgi:predicted nucleic acid-binding protein
VKLVVTEPDSKEAQMTVRDFLKRRFSLHTVDIALAESLNAIWKHTNVHADLGPNDAKAAVQDLIRIHDKLEVLATGELAEDTTTIAQSQDVTIYDALYVAAARKLNGTLLTSDRKLYNTASGLTNTKLLKT